MDGLLIISNQGHNFLSITVLSKSNLTIDKHEFWVWIVYLTALRVGYVLGFATDLIFCCFIGQFFFNIHDVSSLASSANSWKVLDQINFWSPNLPEPFWDFGTNRWLIFSSFTSWNLAFQNWVFTKKLSKMCQILKFGNHTQ